MTKTAASSRRETPAEDQQWAAVCARSAASDGGFYYAVVTTGIYCRPACPARLPKRSNVRFFASCKGAEAAGFRACKRCKPQEATQGHAKSEMIALACRQIETSDEMPTLAGLAATAGLSPHHFHRVFKSVAGLTPKAYANAHRGKRVRAAIAKSPTITGAIHDAGFNTTSRFYAKASGLLGMTPKKFRAGGSGAKIQYAVGQCWLGKILVAMSAKGVCAISLGDDTSALRSELQGLFPEAKLTAGDKKFEKSLAKVVAFVGQPEKGLGLPLDIRGSAFQHRVWEALTRIAPGSTASYTDVAHAIGNRRAVRAVAGACAANKLAVAIPCHRVVRSDGDLSGYRWGTAKKRALLDKESKP